MDTKLYRSTLQAFLGFSILFGATRLWAVPRHEFQTGKLVDVTSDDRVEKGTTHAYAIYEVQLGDIVYFARGEKLSKHPGDLGHGMIVGDPIQAVVEGKDLFIQRPDGKEMKAAIVKRKRASDLR